jgi:integrase/recombinase XerD
MAKTYLTPDEITLLEKAATNLRDKLLIRVLFHLGCRISEALAIKVEDIDFEQGTISIIHLKRRVKLSCASCGARLSINQRFCPGCGVKIDEAS